MEQHLRDEIELGKEVRSALAEENDQDPKIRAMHVRRRVRHAQNYADLKQTYDEVDGA